MSKHLLKIEGLSAGYGPLRVLHEIDFAVAKGERLAIVGLNGHGKTTLFRGEAEIGGSRSFGGGRRTPGIVRMGIAMTPQGDAIFPGLTVRQHLDCGAYTKEAWHGRDARVDKVFDLFPPLRELRDSLVGKLSGGERRMVSIGRALMADAKLYLIDEPWGGLGMKTSERVVDALMNISLDGKAMVIAEQNVELLSGKVDRMIGMHAGRLRGEVGHVDLV
jgi:branched-chain amino acid transport system ATP-binding protein